MTEYLSDKEQVEAIKQWWKNYGRAIAAAIVVGLLIGFGWRYWHRHKTQQAERASMIYMQLEVAVEQHQTAFASQLTAELVKDYADTPYAGLASLLEAKNAVSQNKFDIALARLRWVMQHAKMKSIQQIARLRAARILLAQQHPQAALSLLKTIDDPTYRPMIDNVKGDIYAAQGDKESAKQSYQAAQNELKASGIKDPYLAMKASM